jgi:hypothetical protein
MGGAQSRRPALAQIAKVRIGRFDSRLHFEGVAVAPDNRDVDRQTDAQFDFSVESIEMRPIFSAS